MKKALPIKVEPFFILRLQKEVFSSEVHPKKLRGIDGCFFRGLPEMVTHLTTKSQS